MFPPRYWLLGLTLLSLTGYAERGSRFARRGAAQSSETTGTRPAQTDYYSSVGKGTIRGNIYYAPKEYANGNLPSDYRIRKFSDYQADSEIDHQASTSSAKHQYDARGNYEVSRNGEPIQAGATYFRGGKRNQYSTQGNESLRDKIDAVESAAARHNGIFAEYMHAIANWANQIHAEIAVARDAYRRGDLRSSQEALNFLDYQEERLKELLDYAKQMGSLDPKVRIRAIDNIKSVMGEIYEKYRLAYRQGKVSQRDWNLMDAAYRDFIYRADFARARQ